GVVQIVAHRVDVAPTDLSVQLVGEIAEPLEISLRRPFACRRVDLAEDLRGRALSPRVEEEEIALETQPGLVGEDHRLAVDGVARSESQQLQPSEGGCVLILPSDRLAPNVY